VNPVTGSFVRWARAGCLVLVLLLGLAGPPAQACGCGAYIPRGGKASVDQERALIRWDGRTEDIVMGLSVEGRSREAAWILPVPARATVKLGDAHLFDALEAFTRPRVRVETVSGNGAGAGGAPAGAAPPVRLLKRQALGPFDVSTLAATNAGALSGWLRTNGYRFSPRLASVLRAYVERGWYYVAVRLTPGEGDDGLAGRLDPLRVTFPSKEIVYPMRASSLARGPLSVSLYVLADHRAEPTPQFLDFMSEDGFGDDAESYEASLLKFAGWVEPGSLGKGSPLAPLAPRRLFLTKFDLTINDPSRIRDDFVFSFAGRDDTYREVEVRYEYVRDGLNMHSVRRLWPWLLAGAALAVGAPLLLVNLTRRR
jgi:hypothetical protein